MLILGQMPCCVPFICKLHLAQGQIIQDASYLDHGSLI